jgi:hypothetical protein
VNQHADALVARPREAAPVSFLPDASVCLCNRHAAIVEPNERLQEAARDPGRSGSHPVSFAVTSARECHDCVPFNPSNTVLLGLRVARAYDLAMGQWDRPSLEMNTRPIKVERDIRREDLLAPSHHNSAFLAAACLLCGVMLSVLYVYLPLLLITFAGFDLGAWLMVSVLVGAAASAVALYVWERRNERDFVNEL